MPRNIPDAFLTKLQARSLKGGYCLRIIRQDGVTIRLTNRSSNMTMGSSIYYSSPGLDVSNIQSQADLTADSLNVLIAFDETLVKRADFIAERYMDSQFDLFFVDAEDTTSYMNILSGVLGEVKIEDYQAEVELLSHIERLNYEVGNETTAKCRARFGDLYCKVDLQEYLTAGVVDTVTSNSQFTAYLCGMPKMRDKINWNTEAYTHKWIDNDANWFTYGQIHFSSTLKQMGVYSFDTYGLYAQYYAGHGVAPNPTDPDIYTIENENIRRMVRSYTFVGDKPTFVLARSTPFTIVPGDMFFVTPGCAKSKESCAIFHNEINFQGEPDLPGKDRITGQYE